MLTYYVVIKRVHANDDDDFTPAAFYSATFLLTSAAVEGGYKVQSSVR